VLGRLAAKETSNPAANKNSMQLTNMLLCHPEQVSTQEPQLYATGPQLLTLLALLFFLLLLLLSNMLLFIMLLLLRSACCHSLEVELPQRLHKGTALNVTNCAAQLNHTHICRGHSTQQCRLMA
jgi:hypothetical protein